MGSIPGSGRSPGGGNGNPFQHSCQKILWTEEPGGATGLQSWIQLSTHNIHRYPGTVCELKYILLKSVTISVF